MGPSNRVAFHEDHHRDQRCPFVPSQAVRDARRITFRSVVESALRQFLELQGSHSQEPFRLRGHGFRGPDLQAVMEDDWAAIRERAYEGRGG
jgi:hypothetical protein